MLAILSGFVAGQLVLPTGKQLNSPVLVPAGRAALLAVDYFAAVNQRLADGSSGQVQAMLGLDYVGHPTERGPAETRDQLLARYDQCRRAFPHSQVHAEVLSTGSDLAVVRISVQGLTGGSYAGIPIETEPDLSGIEVLRFKDGKLVERWGQASLPGTFEMVGTVMHTTRPDSPLQPRLERVTLDVNGQLDLGVGVAYLVLMELGETKIQGSYGTSSVSAMPPAEHTDLAADGTPVTPYRGNLALAAGVGPYRLRIINVGAGPAVFLLFRIEGDTGASQLPAPGTTTVPLDVTRVALATGVEVESSSESWIVSIGRVTLEPGIALGSHKVEGTELVLIQSGAPSISSNGCQRQCVETVGGTSEQVSGDVLLYDTEGFSAARGATVSYTAGGGEPSSFLIITMSPQVPETSHR